MRHSRTFVVLTLVFAGYLLASLSGEAEDQTISPMERARRIEQLLNERRDLLAAIVPFRVQQYRDGGIDFDAVVRAKQELTAADLALAKTVVQRIAILEQQLDTYKQAVLVAEERFNSLSAHLVVNFVPFFPRGGDHAYWPWLSTGDR